MIIIKTNIIVYSETFTDSITLFGNPFMLKFLKSNLLNKNIKLFLEIV